MTVRRHLRSLSVLLVGLAGVSLLTVGFGLTPLSGSVFKFGPQGDFSLSSSSPVTAPRGQTSAISVTVTSINHLSGEVSITAALTTSANTLPVVNTSQSSVSLTSDSTASLSISVLATSSTTLGYYNITVQGKTSTVSHSMVILVHITPPPPPPIPDFYLYSNTSSVTTTQGGSVNATLTISSILSYSGNVALTAFVYPAGINSPSVSLNRTNLFLRAGGSNASILMVNTFNATVGYYTISISGISGSLSHTLDIPVLVNHFVGFESLFLEAYYLSSSTNATLYIRNAGSATTTLIAYYVVNASGDQYARTTWNGPVISPNQLGVAAVAIGSSCSSCVLTGAPFTFTPGTYSITVVTSYNNQFTFSITVSNTESLALVPPTILFATNVTLHVQNYGGVPANFVSYNVTDPSGDVYHRASFPGPTIPVGSTVAIVVQSGQVVPDAHSLAILSLSHQFPTSQYPS